MKFNLYILLILFTFFACTNKEVTGGKSPAANRVEEEVSVTPWLTDDAAIFTGSTFGEFFQVLHKTGRYEDMLHYTSKETLDRYSKTELLEFYKNIDFSYPLTLRAEEGNVLLYKTTINATERTIQIPFVIENDTVRIVFKEIEKEKPFRGM